MSDHCVNMSDHSDLLSQVKVNENLYLKHQDLRDWITIVRKGTGVLN